MNKVKKITTDELKITLREVGVKAKRNMINGSYLVSSSLTNDIKSRLARYKSNTGISGTWALANAVTSFKPVKTDVKMFMTPTEIKSTVGFFERPKPDKVFGNRANIKFTSFTAEPSVYTKLNELSEYYGISRAALIRKVLDNYLTTQGY